MSERDREREREIEIEIESERVRGLGKYSALKNDRKPDHILS